MSVLERAKHSLEVLRKERAKVFKAFDIYKSNVEYGIIQEDEETHTKITNWYHLCLELDYESINNVPSEVAKYL